MLLSGLRALALLAIVLGLGTGLARAQAPSVDSLESEFSFDAFSKAVKAKANGGPGNRVQNGATDQTATGEEAVRRAYGSLDLEQVERYHEYVMEQEHNKLLHVAILTGFAFLSLLFVLYMITRRTNYSPGHVVNATGLVLIIYGTIVLTLVSTTEQQLTAAIGILGAVAGYLFGTMQRSFSDDTQAREQAGKQ